MKAMINLACRASCKKVMLITGLALTLSACGGGGGGSNAVAESNEALALRLAAGIDAGKTSEAKAVAQLAAAGF